MKLEPHKHDWAENEPSDAGSCAVADKALGYILSFILFQLFEDLDVFRYKWKVVDCSTSHSTICSQRQPWCQTGFDWVPEFQNNSCFKVASSPYGQTVSSESQSRLHSSFWTAEHFCNAHGSRLATARTEININALLNYGKSLREQQVNND